MEMIGVKMMEWKTLSAVFAMLLLVFPAGLYAENSTAAAMCSGYTKLTIYQTMSSTNQHTFTLVDVSIENTPGTYSAVIDVSRSGQLMEELVVNPGSSASYSATDGTTYTVSVCSNSAGADGTKWAYVKVTPASAPVNHPPTFSSVSCPVTAKSVTCYVYASDPDADTVTYTINFGDNTGQVSGMQNVFAHTYQMAGTYTISIEAKDKYGASVGTALQVTVTGNENQKPIISSVSGPSTLSVNQKGTWTVSAYDPDGTYLSYTVNWGESTPSSSDSMGRIGSTSSFEHTYSKAGTYTITFGVKDAQGASAQSTASVMVGSSSAPTVDLKVNGMDEPSAVPFNGKFTVSWKSNGDYCAAGGHHVLLPNGSVWTEFYNLPASGSMTLIAAHKNYGYLTPLEIGIGCYKGTEGASDKVYVPVTATSTNTSTCPSYYSKISVGSGINVQSGGYQYTAKLIDISADSDGAAMIQVLDANDAVLAHAKVSPGITYVYSGSGTSSGANARLAVDVCKSPASSDRSYAMMFAQMTSLPGTDSCKGYPELYAGGELDRGTFRVKVKDVYTGQNIAASQRYATIEILDANDVSLKTTTIYPGAAYTYTQTGTSNSVTVKVCETAYGTAAGTKWAKVDATTSSNGGSTGLKVNRIWTEPDPITSQYSTTIYSEILDGTQPANPNGVKVTYYYTFPDGSRTSGLVGPSAQNPEYKNKGYFGVDLGSGAPCGGYSLKVTAERTITSSTQTSSPATGEATFTLSEPYCTPSTKKISLRFEKGWNMVSAPTNYDVQLSDIQKKCGITSAWYYNPNTGQYSAATTLGKGKIGVWMKATSACTYELEAPYISSWNTAIKAGWNMIGAPAKSASFASVSGSCKITSGPWNYSPSAGQYVASSTLEPGKGYWVKAAADCTLDDLQDSPPEAPTYAVQGASAN